ncbi:MAG TPA: hypothetical protein VMI12_18700 [Puia sp.]|nr:hypothetical protein [Puia sp.]
MKIKTFLRTGYFLVFFAIKIIACAQDNELSFDRSAFYQAMASEKRNLVDDQLSVLKNISITGKQAFEGALLMKKAGLSGSPDKKLSLFKSGHKKLETAIHEDSTNAEFRFLRLMVQEHAPGILGYKNEIKTDSDYIRKSYKKLPGVVQEAILDYSKKSKALKLQDS